MCCLTEIDVADQSVSLICSDNWTCCLTETEVADQTFYLIQSQYTDTGQTSPSADLTTPGARQGSHWITSFQATSMTRPRKKKKKKKKTSTQKAGIKPRSAALEADTLTTRPTRRCSAGKNRPRRKLQTGRRSGGWGEGAGGGGGGGGGSA